MFNIENLKLQMALATNATEKTIPEHHEEFNNGIYLYEFSYGDLPKKEVLEIYYFNQLEVLFETFDDTCFYLDSFPDLMHAIEKVYGEIN